DLNAEVTVGFEDAVFGCDKVISLKNPDGTQHSLQVHIPAGIDTGKLIRLRGKGMPGSNGEAGDLLLKVNVQSKSGYERKGQDLYTTVNIPYTTAVFGGEARVQTLYGDVICKIKEGTQSGTKIRLRGKGIVSMKNPSVHGDQYVTVQIDVPKHLSREARQKLMEYKQVC
ncbi:MAG: HSP40/DnaJ peptide-binding protein, partial [Lachnospiraceae bacterium]|nr:HSP40/DnaJ peptide-binding protein [Lachnospiraceae bacterium]